MRATKEAEAVRRRMERNEGDEGGREAVKRRMERQ